MTETEVVFNKVDHTSLERDNPLSFFCCIIGNKLCMKGMLIPCSTSESLSLHDPYSYSTIGNQRQDGQRISEIFGSSFFIFH